MKIKVGLNRELILEEVYGAVIRTAEGNELAVCMRDDTVEVSVPEFDRWFRVDMKTGDITEM